MGSCLRPPPSAQETSQAVKKNHKKPKKHTHLNRYPRQLKKCTHLTPPFLFGKKIEKNQTKILASTLQDQSLSHPPPTPPKKLYSYSQHLFTPQTIKVKHGGGG